jgi:hypothetical protein
MKRLLLTLLALSAFWLAAAPSASACSCVPLVLNKQTFKRWDAAIVGRVVSTKERGQTAVHKVRLLRVYKGGRLKKRRFVRIATASGGASCGLEPGRNGRFAAFLYKRPKSGPWRTNSCLQADPAAMRRAAKNLGRARTLGCG